MAIPSLPKLNFSVPFAMTAALPLDYNSYFSSLADARAAASTAEAPGSTNTIYYYGQIIVVITSSSADLYMIQPDKTLKPFDGSSGGGGDDKTFVYTQSSAAQKWSIEHRLNKYPSVTVVDSGNNVVVGEVTYVDENNVRINFDSAFSGKAYLN